MKSLISSLSAMLLTAFLFAQHPVNVAPANGQLLSEPQYGVSTNIPAGWVAKANELGYLLQKQGETGFIIITGHQAESIAELRTESQKGLVEPGVSLLINGELSTFQDRGVMAFLKGTIQGQEAEAYALALISPNGGGLSIIAVNPQAPIGNEYPRLVHSIANSTKFKKIDKSSEVAEWHSYLNGVRLTYMDSYNSNTPGGGGYNIEKKLDLCPGGTYYYYGSDFTSFGGGYMDGRNYATGKWKVSSSGTDIYLELVSDQGKQNSFLLTYPDNKTHLNGARWFRTTAADGGDYAPDCN